MTEGALIGLDLGHVRPGGRIVEATAGALRIEGTRFTNAGTGGGGNEAAVVATGTADVTILPGQLDNLLGTPAYGFAAARENARIRIAGGALVGGLSTGYSGNALLVAADSGSIELDGVRVEDAAQPYVLALLGSSTGRLVGGTQLSGNGSAAGVHMLGRSTLIIQSATLQRFTQAIGASIYEATNPTIDATDAVLSINGYGVNFGGDTSPLEAHVRFVGGRIVGSTNAGFRTNVPGSYTFEGTTIRDNGANGLDFWNTANAYAVRARGCTLTGNGGSGVLFSGAASSSLDLGTLAEPGGNTLTGNARGAAAADASVRLGTAGVVASAVGNTWNPSVQGASAAGAYSASGPGATLDVLRGSGPNYNVTAGTLRLAQNP
jgi:hypothetical protein